VSEADLPDAVISEIARRVARGEAHPGDDVIPFDPTTVRIKRGRVWFPGAGWIYADCGAPPRSARLTKAELRRDSDGWAVHVGFEVPDGSLARGKA
jgi:hypothetical protein